MHITLRLLTLAFVLDCSDAWTSRAHVMGARAQWRKELADLPLSRRHALHRENEDEVSDVMLQNSRRGFLEGASVATALVGLQDPARAADDAVDAKPPLVNGATDGKNFSAAWSAVTFLSIDEMSTDESFFYSALSISSCVYF